MIKRNKCSIEGCNFSVWKNRKCKFHNIDVKQLTKDIILETSRQKTIKKISEAVQKKRKEKIALTKELHQFMFNWWSSLPAEKRLKCWACGRKLKDEFSTAYVDHLLEKSQYPNLAFNPINFFVCCLDCHGNKTNGFPKPKHKEAIDKAKQIFLYPLTPDDCYSE